jgi:hypothetical protein
MNLSRARSALSRSNGTAFVSEAIAVVGHPLARSVSAAAQQ